MVCPYCKTMAGIDKNIIIEDTPEKEVHKQVFICRNRNCKRYKQEIGSEEYTVEKPLKKG